MSTELATQRAIPITGARSVRAAGIRSWPSQWARRRVEGMSTELATPRAIPTNGARSVRAAGIRSWPIQWTRRRLEGLSTELATPRAIPINGARSVRAAGIRSSPIQWMRRRLSMSTELATPRAIPAAAHQCASPTRQRRASARRRGSRACQITSTMQCKGGGVPRQAALPTLRITKHNAVQAWRRANAGSSPVH